jgi:hypothetical protein
MSAERLLAFFSTFFCAAFSAAIGSGLPNQKLFDAGAGELVLRLAAGGVGDGFDEDAVFPKPQLLNVAEAVPFSFLLGGGAGGSLPRLGEEALAGGADCAPLSSSKELRCLLLVRAAALGPALAAADSEAADTCAFALGAACGSAFGSGLGSTFGSGLGIAFGSTFCSGFVPWCSEGGSEARRVWPREAADSGLM